MRKPIPEVSLQHLERVFSIELNSDLRQRCAQYVKLLRHWSARVNLAGPALLQDPYPHLFEAFWADQQGLVPADSLLDIGSGAGFPGLALALYRPGMQVTLIEPNHKKALFLREAGRLLKLRIRVHQTGFETFQEWGSYQLATLRGLRPTPPLLRTLRLQSLPWLWFRGGDQGLKLPGFQVRRQLQTPGSRARWLTLLEPSGQHVSREI